MYEQFTLILDVMVVIIINFSVVTLLKAYSLVNKDFLTRSVRNIDSNFASFFKHVDKKLEH